MHCVYNSAARNLKINRFSEIGWKKIWLLKSQLFFCTKCQNQALKCNTSTFREKKENIHMDTAKFPLGKRLLLLICHVLWHQCWLATPCCSFVYTQSGTSEETRKVQSTFPSLAVKCPYRRLFSAKSTVQEPRLHGRVVSVGAKGEGSSVLIRIQEWAAGNRCKR